MGIHSIGIPIECIPRRNRYRDNIGILFPYNHSLLTSIKVLEDMA